MKKIFSVLVGSNLILFSGGSLLASAINDCSAEQAALDGARAEEGKICSEFHLRDAECDALGNQILALQTQAAQLKAQMDALGQELDAAKLALEACITRRVGEGYPRQAATRYCRQTTLTSSGRTYDQVLRDHEALLAQWSALLRQIQELENQYQAMGCGFGFLQPTELDHLRNECRQAGNRTSAAQNALWDCLRAQGPVAPPAVDAPGVIWGSEVQ